MPTETKPPLDRAEAERRMRECDMLPGPDSRLGSGRAIRLDQAVSVAIALLTEERSRCAAICDSIVNAPKKTCLDTGDLWTRSAAKMIGDAIRCAATGEEAKR